MQGGDHEMMLRHAGSPEPTPPSSKTKAKENPWGDQQPTDSQPGCSSWELGISNVPKVVVVPKKVVSKKGKSKLITTQQPPIVNDPVNPQAAGHLFNPAVDDGAGALGPARANPPEDP